MPSPEEKRLRRRRREQSQKAEQRKLTRHTRPRSRPEGTARRGAWRRRLELEPAAEEI
jgi:hypothetical protein